MLVYNPERRLKPLEAICHPFFDELRQESTTLPNGNALPELFTFTREELMQADPQLTAQMIPDWHRARVEAQERAGGNAGVDQSGL